MGRKKNTDGNQASLNDVNAAEKAERTQAERTQAEKLPREGFEPVVMHLRQKIEIEGAEFVVTNIGSQTVTLRAGPGVKIQKTNQSAERLLRANKELEEADRKRAEAEKAEAEKAEAEE